MTFEHGHGRSCEFALQREMSGQTERLRRGEGGRGRYLFLQGGCDGAGVNEQSNARAKRCAWATLGGNEHFESEFTV